MKTADIYYISRLRTFTDGDGISTLVGFMGCPLRCAYCINPDSWDRSVNPQKMTVDELYSRICPDNLYYLATGGGIVFGGGEPLIHHEFIKNFITKYKSTSWKFGLETSLSTKTHCLSDIIDLVDFFIVDVKDMDGERYNLYTKGNYNQFLKNLEFLKDNVDASKIRLRVPKIPDFHRGGEVYESEDVLFKMGFEDIEIFDYIIPDEIKNISKKAVANKNEFIKSAGD